MKLGIETCTLRNLFGDEEAICLIGNAGFDSLDYSFYGTAADWTMLDGDYAGYASRIRAQLKRCNLSCTQTHAPIRFHFGCQMTEDDPLFQEIVRSIEFASLIGAQYIVVHSVLTPAGVDLLNYNLLFFQSLIPYCERFGVYLGFENIFDYDPYKRCMGRFATPEQVNGFLDRLASRWAVCCLDTGHAAIAGTRPEAFIKGMDAHRLRLLHIQDTDYMDDRHQLPYIGCHDWDAITAALAGIGYQGDFTFEIPGFFKQMDRELIPDALRFAAITGRRLIQKIDDAKAAVST